MTTNRPKLPADAFYSQFHHVTDAHHSVNHPTREWWDLYDDLPETDGKAVNYARGGDVKEPKRHPAHGIPGIHIVGHNPVFTGEK
jgi:hypothetical protein